MKYLAEFSNKISITFVFYELQAGNLHVLKETAEQYSGPLS